MADNFFDESILENKKSQFENYPSLKDYKNFRYVLKQTLDGFQIFCEINSERLNSGELKALLKLNEEKNFLSDSDVALINYIFHRLIGNLTIYKIMNDVGLIFSYLKESNMKTIFDDGKVDMGIAKIDYNKLPEIKFANKKLELDIDINFDLENNVVLDIKNKGDFIFSTDQVFYIIDNNLYELNSNIPAKFYKEIFSGKNKFSIESFFSLKKSLLTLLKEHHNVKISKEVEDLVNLNVEERVAPVVIEVAKSNHFVALHLKYKIGNEFFNVEDYKYAETINWMDKKQEIKIIKEKDNLIQYKSDLGISEDEFLFQMQKFRIRFSQNSKSPFLLMFPISNLEILVKQIIPELEKTYKIEYKDGVALRLTDGNVKFEIETNLKSRLDLFEFKVKFNIEEQEFDIDFLKEVIQQNKKFVQLEDGTTVNIENIREINKWIEFLKRFTFKKSENVYKTESKVALELDEFLKSFKEKNIKSNDEYKNMILELKEKTPITPIELPENVDSILRNYQKEGIYWLHFLKKYGFGGILADEMGLGKTLQALTILDMNKDLGPHIVICPKTLIYNWEFEAKKYFPNMRVLVISGDSNKRKKLIETSNDYDLIITSYSMLQKDYRYYIEFDLKYGYQILDEAHYVKNMKTLSAKAVRLINAQNIVLLTGTPLENNLDELYGTFDLVMPEYLGSKIEFNREFASKIERNNMIALEILQAKIRPFILRRIKSEVLKELPEKQEQVVYSAMTNKQIAIYNEVLNRVKIEVNELVKNQGFDKSKIQVLSALLKLRQVCNHPSLVDKDFTDEEDISGKYNQFQELLSEVIDNGEKVLVFSQFTSMLDIMEKDLKKEKIKYLRLDGSTKNRQELVEEFNNDKSTKIFLISLKAGGVGINLTSASAVFLYDPWWNPMVERQAMDRAHRIGQKKTVNIYKFITKNSIEEKILKLQERKGNLFDNLVNQDRGFIKRLEWEDLMELFD